jgi:hypothetical protein
LHTEGKFFFTYSKCLHTLILPTHLDKSTKHI